MTVRDYSSQVEKMAQVWPLLDAVYGGTKTMREAGKKFLPQWPGETDASFKSRLGNAVLFPAFGRTSEILASKPFSRPITTTGASADLEELMEDIDDAGRGIHAFFFDVMENCLSRGISGVLADYPPAADVKTVKQQKESGVRPYLVHYPAGTVLGWRATNNTLTQLRLLETEIVEDGAFGDKAIEQVRVFYAGVNGANTTWETYRKDPNEIDPEKAWKVNETGEISRKDIPFRFFYGKRIAFGVGESPLEELAYLNIEHWQSACDQQTILHVARIPILFMKGFGANEPLVIGASTAVQSAHKDAELSYVEHTGAAISAGRQSLLDLEERMRAIGAELLVRKTNRMTATQVESEDTAGDCMLQAIVEMFELGVEECLEMMAEWLGEPNPEVEVEIFSEFSESSLSDAMANVIFTAVAGRNLSRETAFKALKDSGVIDPERTWEQEKAAIATDPVIPTGAPTTPTPKATE